MIAEPKFEFIHDSIRVRLIEDWTFPLENGLVAIVPAGFETDLASIPRFLWPIFSPMGDFRMASILHDFGYQYGYLLSPTISQVYNRQSIKFRKEHKEFGLYTPVFVGKDRKFFDELFRYVTIKATGAKVKANVAYFGLRMFGWIAWNKYRRKGSAAFNTNSLNLPE